MGATSKRVYYEVLHHLENKVGKGLSSAYSCGGSEENVSFGMYANILSHSVYWLVFFCFFFYV